MGLATHSVGNPEPMSGGERVEEGSEDRDQKGIIRIQGTPVSRGKSESRACVVREVSDAESIRSGDILICEITDVGWSPYFPLIRGLVTELGSMLSHGAVVAREYGIPAVVNVRDATSHIRTGDWVCIDGDTGGVSFMHSDDGHPLPTS